MMDEKAYKIAETAFLNATECKIWTFDDFKIAIETYENAKASEVTMNHLLRILDDAAKKCGIFSWEEGLRAIRLHCEIYPNPMKKKDQPI